MHFLGSLGFLLQQLRGRYCVGRLRHLHELVDVEGLRSFLPVIHAAQERPQLVLSKLLLQKAHGYLQLLLGHLQMQHPFRGNALCSPLCPMPWRCAYLQDQDIDKIDGSGVL